MLVASRELGGWGMSLKVIGAGVGRTGTRSLKRALELLFEQPCYHMVEIFDKPEHIDYWGAVSSGAGPDWDWVFDGYDATVDWPAASFWRELADAYPEALVLLSVRDADAWYDSARATIFEPDRPSPQSIKTMMKVLKEERFASDVLDMDIAIAAFHAHNDAVRASVPADRLLEWRPGDGWDNLCAALGVPVPDIPFPRINTRDDFKRLFLNGTD